MASDEPGNGGLLTQIHDQVAIYIRQLDEFMRGLSPEQARELVGEARHLLTVATFLRDATIDLLESAGEELDEQSLDPLVGPAQ